MTSSIELEGLSEDIFKLKYAYPGEKKWVDRAKAIARHIASVESDEKKTIVEAKFYDAIRCLDFIPGGRIIFGSGRNNYNLLNCYVLEPEDTVESIGKTVADMYKISCAGGGVGFNFSKIRPRGDDIQNIKHSAPGSVSVMRMVNEIGEHVRAGKSRRTALIGILDIRHPDILEFLKVKLEKGELENFNISIAITNKFLEAIDNDEDWYFTFNNKKYFRYICGDDSMKNQVVIVALSKEDALARANNHKTVQVTYIKVEEDPIKARELWDYIFKYSVISGDPGIFNIDLANSYTNVSYFENCPATNPCGEIPLPPYGNCCLGHINLSNMVSNSGEIDWKRLARVIRTGIRFLDNVLTANTFPIPECREIGHKSRRIGLGVTGLHYFLIKAGYKYGDEACLEFLERVFSTIRDEAYKASIALAKEKGSFPAFNAKQFLRQEFAKTLPPRIRTDIKRDGLRNAVMLTIAPTGTISMLAGVSTGIEPIFSPAYKRRYRDAGTWKEVVVLDPLYEKFFLEGRDLSNFCGAYDVTPEEHIKVQATVQRFIDSSISKTINLPADFDYKKLVDIILDYMPYLKGCTIYRAGSKGTEPLEVIKISSDEELFNIIKEKKEIYNDDVNCKSGACEL